MHSITIDFETYYDKDYSLSKMTTESYIRDQRFEVIGVTVMVGDSIPVWYSGDDVAGFLAQYDFTDKICIAHNAAFDGAILNWKCGIKPKMWMDTLSMAQPFHMHDIGVSLRALSSYYKLGDKGTEVYNAIGKRRADFSAVELAAYGEYCNKDVRLTYKLAKELINRLPRQELQVIDLSIRMFTEPVLTLDVPKLEAHLAAERIRKQNIIDSVRGNWTEAEFKKILMSNQQFAAMLEERGVVPPTKTSRANGKATYAFAKTDKDFLELQEHPDPEIAALVTARLGIKSTIEETRTESLLGIAARGLLPVMLKYCGAHTFRFSGGDKLNLQNLPRGGTLRDCITAPPGHKIIVCDSSQIEARLVAFLANHSSLVGAFRDGRDIYSEFASLIYERLITKANEKERFVGKTAILGLGYYCGPDKFRHMLAIGQGGIKVHIDLDESKRIVKMYRTNNRKICQLWYRANDCLNEMIKGNATGALSDTVGITFDGPTVKLPNGMVLQYPNLAPDALKGGFTYTSRNKTIGLYSGKLVENMTQALARIVIAEQMVKIGQRYKVALQVHDEIVCVVKDEEEAEAKDYIRSIMSTPPAWAMDLPVACECDSGNSYGAAK